MNINIYSSPFQEKPFHLMTISVMPAAILPIAKTNSYLLKWGTVLF